MRSVCAGSAAWTAGPWRAHDEEAAAERRQQELEREAALRRGWCRKGEASPAAGGGLAAAGLGRGRDGDAGRSGGVRCDWSGESGCAEAAVDQAGARRKFYRLAFENRASLLCIQCQDVGAKSPLHYSNAMDLNLARCQ